MIKKILLSTFILCISNFCISAMHKTPNDQLDTSNNTDKPHQLRFNNIPIDCLENFNDATIELSSHDIYTILQKETESSQTKMIIWLCLIAKAAFDIQDKDIQDKLIFTFTKNENGSVDLIVENVLKDSNQ